MAFATKRDYCGLATAASSALEIKDDNYNGASEIYQPQGQNGSFAGMEVYGEDAQPANTYTLKADLTATLGTFKLNNVTSVNIGTTASPENKQLALSSIKISTGAGKPVEVSATSQLVESTATSSNQTTYQIPAFSVDTKQEAQSLFSAFTIAGEGCELIVCDAEAKAAISTDKLAGVIKSSDCNSGVIVVTGTILSVLGNVPVVTASAASVTVGDNLSSNWVLTKAAKPTEQNPETAYKQYDFEVQLPLKKTYPSA